tara:strand:- start:278 stop:1099 length:822 start_codon:yes stop_codon:yes gene_type:complete
MDMIDFKTLPISKRVYQETYPILLPVSEWEFKKHQKFWLVDNIFKEGGLDLLKEMAQCYPIVDNNNADDDWDHNPFKVFHLPYWITAPICEAVREFVLREYFHQGPELQLIDERLSEWGNIYVKEDCRPLVNSCIPHVDFPHDEGWIANLWLSQHEEEETGTNLYDFKGAIDEGRFDFQLDSRHQRYTEWHSWVGDGKNHTQGFQNLTRDKAFHWGFRKIEQAPCKYGTMTIYNGNTPHCPFIDDSVQWRWSHAFGFKYKSLARVFNTQEVQF